MRLTVVALLGSLVVACGDSTSPRLAAGTFAGTITTNTAASPLIGDSAIWVTTGRGLFNTDLVSDSTVPGIPAPLTIFVGLQDSTLVGGALPPGTYQLSATDSTRPLAAILAAGFQALSDSGTMIVTSARSDTVFQGRLDAWLHDTTTGSAARFHVTARFAAIPFH